MTSVRILLRLLETEEIKLRNAAAEVADSAEREELAALADSVGEYRRALMGAIPAERLPTPSKHPSTRPKKKTGDVPKR